MLCPEICLFLGYWYSLCKGNSVPQRGQLDLRELTSILPWMFILEMAPDGALRYRLAGSALESAMGRGMAGRTYSSVLSETEQGSVMEEMYATALVQGCGILRTGTFQIEADSNFDLEVLSLPFVEERAMGGVIMVGVVRPFEVNNQGFIDKWGGFEQSLQQLLVVPSPRALMEEHLSKRVKDLLDNLKVTLRAIDLPKVIEIDRKGQHQLYTAIPSLSLANIDTSFQHH